MGRRTEEDVDGPAGGGCGGRRSTEARFERDGLPNAQLQARGAGDTERPKGGLGGFDGHIVDGLAGRALEG